MADMETFASKVGDCNRSLAIFGIVPPPARLALDRVEFFATKLADSLKTLPGCDGVIVYDIQEEKGRTVEERPFPFSATHEPRYYARLINGLTQLETILYRAVADNPKEGFDDWLIETRENFGIHNMVLVGSSCSSGQYPGYTVKEAAGIITKKSKYSDYCLGGITLPERHRDKGIEHEILISKSQNGISFFTSQVVYNADNAITLLKDYDSLCKERGIKPSRIIFAFAPFGSEDTVKFMKWLGVELPQGTIRRVLSRCTLQARIEESIEICSENFTRIMEVVRKYELNIPIGFTVECVSKSREEGEGALKLFTILKRLSDKYYPSRC